MHDSTDDVDLGATYERDAGRLEGLVARNIAAASPEVVEEACQIAWARLHARGGPPAGSAFGWLATTAQREALLLVRRQSRELPFTAEAAATVIAFPARRPGPERIVELRERLAEVQQLPVRQRRMIWLQGYGYDYEEIAARTGDSKRTVERQLARARTSLNARRVNR